VADLFVSAGDFNENPFPLLVVRSEESTPPFPPPSRFTGGMISLLIGDVVPALAVQGAPLLLAKRMCNGTEASVALVVVNLPIAIPQEILGLDCSSHGVAQITSTFALRTS
jgi:hypothetical protein